MKPMTNSAARKLGKAELYGIFRTLGFKDGLSQKVRPNEFSYWYNKARTGEYGNYITFEVIDSDAIHRADDVIISRDFFCQLDIFSVNSFETSLMSEMLTKLETALIIENFEVTIQEETYEPDTRFYHAILFLSKIYFTGGKLNA